MAPLTGGDDVLLINPKVAQDAASDASGNKTRNQDRVLNAPDKMGTGRAPKGEGRQQA